MSQVRLDFTGRLDGRTQLGDGSVRFTARLTRTGVFDYGDHRELRRPEDVFAAESMASFKGVAVTDGHRAFIDASNWKEHAIGHVGDDVHQDGEYLVASIVVKDQAALAKIDRGDLVELSMGYTVNLDATPGEHQGEKYDAVQKDIVGNHAALGPKAWGRAGGAVKLLDGAAYAPGMSTPVARTDAPGPDAARVDALTAENEKLRKDAADERARADRAEAERDAARKDATDAKAALEQAKKDEDARVTVRVSLIDSARSLLPKDFTFSGKSDRDIRVAALQKADPSAKFDGKSDAYVEARFDLAVESAKEGRAALASVNEAATPPASAAPEKSRLDEALERQAKEREAQEQAGPPKGAAFVK